MIILLLRFEHYELVQAYNRSNWGYLHKIIFRIIASTKKHDATNRCLAMRYETHDRIYLFRVLASLFF